MAPSPVNLRNALDRDAYQVVKKLEDANGGRPFATVSAAYDAVKRSNSSLSRQKKRPLEDALDRVLQVRHRERQADQLDDDQDDDPDTDSEPAMDVDDPDAATKMPDERFLLNRQMTRHWNVTPATMPSVQTGSTRDEQQQQHPIRKKRRALDDEADKNTLKDCKDDTSRPKSTRIQKKTVRPLYQVEHDMEAPPMAGLGHAYTELFRLARGLLVKPQRYDMNRWRRLPGILLSGPPGTGKRTLVRKLAADLRVAVINLTDCFEEPERIKKSLAEAFDAALAAAPCIVCVEHLDLFMAKPGAQNHADHHQRALSALRQQMQRVREQAAPVLAMATTSYAADVNPALFGTGLFEKAVQLRVPDAAARQAILAILTDRIALGPDVRLDELARMTHGFVGGDLVIFLQHAITAADSRLDMAMDPTLSSLSSLRPSSLLAPAQADNDDDDDDNDDDMVAPTVLPSPDAISADRWLLRLDDFKAAIRDYVPLLRKEGFTVVPSVRWSQVGALASVRHQLHTSIIGPIRQPDLYQSFGIRRPAGCLLWGPPGCGKTLVAQAVAHEAQASFILISGPELLNKYVGESERAVRELFQRARSSTPCILFFDEMDAMVPRREAASTDAGVRVVNALLAEMDGAQGRDGVYVIATTNRPDMIDPAMLRPGRLSVRLFIDLPTAEERVEILAAIYRTLHPEETRMNGGGGDGGGDGNGYSKCLEAVARDPRCQDFSGADLDGLHTKAAEFGLQRYLRAVEGGGGGGGSDGDGDGDDGDGDGGGGGGSMAKEIIMEDWEAALAVTTCSVRDPEKYRRLDERLKNERKKAT